MRTVDEGAGGPMTGDNSTSSHDRDPGARGILAICFVLMLVDGYDVVSFGTVVPSLLFYPAWQMTAGQVGLIGAAGLAGMAVGAVAVGQYTDRIGHRRAVVGCAVWFSLAMGLCALAPTPSTLGLLRFLAGLGLGGLFPAASSLVIARSAPGRRVYSYAIMCSGYPLGGIVAAVVARRALEPLGFRSMFAFGLIALVLVPFALRYLPRRATSSPRWVSGNKGHLDEVLVLFRRRYLLATLLFWTATFFALFVIYGLYTWLPEIMRQSGYQLDTAIAFLLALNVGGVVGMLGSARMADRLGSRRVAVAACLCASLSVAALSLKPSAAVGYSLIVLAGIGAIGAQMLINAAVADHFPPSNRASALGWSLGVGRLGAIVGPPAGALVVSLAVGVEYHFYVFAGASLLAAASLAAIRKPHDPHAETSLHNRRRIEGAASS